MTPLANLALLGGDAAPAIGTGLTNAPKNLQRWQRVWTDMFPLAQDSPASGRVVIRYRADATVRAFDQGTADLTDKAMALWVRASVRPPAAAEGPSGSDRERAEAQWAILRPLRGIGDRAAWYSNSLNEPMGSPALGRDFEAHDVSDSASATDVRKQKKRNRMAIRLMDVWLDEDAAVESDTWELLKSELDRDRLSTRRLWT